MFTYSFAIKLTDRTIDPTSTSALLQSDHGQITVAQMEPDVFLVSSKGHESKEHALRELANILIKTKITLLKLKIAHQDWFSINSSQRFATNAIGSLFDGANIVPTSYKPQVYETNRMTHWPGAIQASEPFVLEAINDIVLPTANFNFGTGRTLEALSVLGLALAAQHAKSKLILSMTVVEVLSDRREIDQDMVGALELLEEKIPSIETTPEVKADLVKLLGDAKREKISKAGKRTVKEYLGRTRSQEFWSLYDLRSRLVHGDSSRLTFDIQGHPEIEKAAEDGFNLASELTFAYRESAKS